MCNKTKPRPRKTSGRHVFLKPENRLRENVPKRPTCGSALRSSESVAVYFRSIKKIKIKNKTHQTVYTAPPPPVHVTARPIRHPGKRHYTVS